jgi:tRNA(Ile)-lysidine synthase
MFYSKNYSLNKDREQIIISPQENIHAQKRFYIDETQEWISEPFEMSIDKISWNFGDVIPRDAKTVYVDAQTIDFPLIIRRWSSGDFFQPFGMKGFKKLSDFFIDQKIPKIEKENTWIIESANRIVWLVGHRLDDRFKITDNTCAVLKLHMF